MVLIFEENLEKIHPNIGWFKMKIYGATKQALHSPYLKEKRPDVSLSFDVDG